MTFTINLTPAEEARLQELAAQAKIEPEAMAAQLISRELFYLTNEKPEEPEPVLTDSDAAREQE
jgi:hypothetical protein